MPETRQIVVPGERVGNPSEHRPGMNTYEERDGIYALRLGVKSVRGDRVDVISLNGRYEPGRGDMVIGTVAEVGPSNWYINIGAANDVGMHVNDTPWRVDFGETSKYLAVGDTVLLKIVHVDELKKAQVSMKDRACRKLAGGLILEVAPSKVPRIVGRQGSMIAMIKDATNVRIFVGQNGVIWIDGEQEDVALALEGLRKIEDEAHTSGLTDRMKAWLEERRPTEKRVHKQSTDEVPAEEEARPVRHGRSEADKHRRERPAEDTVSDAEAAEEISRRPAREGPTEGGHVRHHSERRAGGEREHRGEHRGGREERPREERGPRREERPAARFEERGPRREERPAPRSDDRPRERRDDERPARRFEESERPARREEAPRREEPRRPRTAEGGAEPQFGGGPARRFGESDERPARRDEMPRREERPARRFEEERPARRFEESSPRPEERPARRFEDAERPARREERPMRREESERPVRRFEDREERPRAAPPTRRIMDDDEEAPRPPRRFADEESSSRPPPRPVRRASDDDEESDDRPARRDNDRGSSGGDGGRGRRRGGRGRGGSGRAEGGPGRRQED